VKNDRTAVGYITV